MNIFEQRPGEDIGESITKLLEEQTGNKIFTLRVEDEKSEEGLGLLVVFENKEILMGRIIIQPIEGKLAARVQANYI